MSSIRSRLDHASSRRLTIFGRAQALFADENPDAIAAPARPGDDAVVERAVVVAVEAFDRNCPQHITPRFTAREGQPVIDRLQQRIAVLEADNARLRDGPSGPSAVG
jgi:uncharacterized protein